MAPINFEDHIKNKMEQRELKPSVNAWKTLRAQLDESDSKKNRKPYWWLGLAASFIGVLLIASFLYNGNEKEKPAVVETEKIQFDVPEATIDLVSSSDENAIDEDEKIISSSNEEKKVNNNQSVLNSKHINEQQKTKSNEANHAVTSRKEIRIEKPNNEIMKSDAVLSFEEQKIMAVASEIRMLQDENNEISEKEIDALLNAAQKEITKNKIYNEATKTVDAESLLRSVEEDLEESFRSRVFKLLQNGYEGVKTAVAERNN